MRCARTRIGRWSRGNPLTAPVLLLVVAYVVSTLASVSPNTSLLGSYERTQGLYTTFSYIVIFFLAASTIRSRGQIARAVDVALVVSFPVAFYGIIQHYALDPLSWPHGAAPARVTSTIGNPAFLGAYVMLIIPLTLMRLIAQTGRLAGQVHAPLGRATLYGGVVVSCVGLAVLWGASFDLGAKTMIEAGVTRVLTLAMLNAARANFNLALAISLVALAGWCLAGLSIKRRAAAGLLIGVYVLLLALQVTALWFTQSRGPFVGLLGGLFTLVVLRALLRGARRVAFGALGAVLAALAVLALLSSGAVASLVPLRDPYMKRLMHTFSTAGGTTAQVRALIWEGALRLALPHEPLWSPTTGDDRLNAFRPLIGYGPESMYAAYNQFYPPELARVEVRTAKPDRAHNETLDALVQLGLPGAAASLLLFGSIAYLGCKWLGFIATPRSRRSFVALWLAGAAGMALGAGLAFGWPFLGAALPAGMLLGFFVYMFVGFSESARRAHAACVNRSPARDALLATLLAALIGHWLEIQFGVAVTATRIYFWFFAALLVSVGVRQLPEDEPAQAASATNGAQVSAAPLIAFGLLTGLILAIMAFDIVSARNASEIADEGTRALDLIVAALTTKNTTDGLQPSLAMVWLFAGTLLLALVVGVAEWGRGLQLRLDEWLLAVGLLLLTPLAIVSLFIFYHTFLIGMSDSDSLGALASTFPSFVLFLIAVVLVSALALAFEQRLARMAPARSWSWIAVPVVGIIGLVSIAVTNVSVVQADMLYKQAPRFAIDEKGVITSFQQALALQPAQDYAFVFLGNAYLAQARELSDPVQRNELLAQAQAALLRARQINPLDSDHTVLLAQLQQTWAALAVVPSEKDDHFRKSLAYYAQALRLSPNAAHLYDQYALALLDAAALLEQRQDAAGALAAQRAAQAQLARAYALDPTFCLTLAIRADTRSEWAATARDALDALRLVPLCHVHLDPFEQQAHTLALKALARAARQADAAGAGAAFASTLKAEARAYPSVDISMTLADYYARHPAVR